MTGTEAPDPARTAVHARMRAIRMLPFVAAGVIGTAAIAIARPVNGAEMALAAAVACFAAVLAISVPWERLPSLAGALPALIFVLAIAIVRDAVGGPIAGVGPLVLLPVLWVGLYGTRLQLAAIVPAIAVVFFAPIALVGPPKYPMAQWGVGVMYVAIALLIGLTVQRLIGRIQAQADEAGRREREIARVADVARRLSSGEATRRDVCAAASELGGASFTLLWEPDGDGRLAVTASAGIDRPALVVDPSRERAAVLTAFRTKAPIFVPEVTDEPSVNPRLLALVPDAVSVLFQPVLRHGEPVGVMVVGWNERVEQAEDRMRMLVGLLVAEAAIAIERADLLTKLEELADTDELTGLPNRRAWNRELDVAISTAQRRDAPLCVALIDVDYFKELNDASGHQAGDRMLKAAAAAWRSTLRPADVLARPGGDEFTLVLPDCDIDRASVVLERLREATPGSRTCSIGVAQWDGVEPADGLVRRVDEALYAAKEGGRDRIVVAS